MAEVVNTTRERINVHRSRRLCSIMSRPRIFMHFTDYKNVEKMLEY